jgi:N-acetylmuramoyl-L-alanine amidase CwlA
MIGMSVLDKIKTNIANRANYGNKRSLASIKYLVLHYTGNDGDTDENNGKYFRNNVVKTSAHYFVDDDSVTQSVPDNYIAWHCGATTYKHGTCRNTNSIGIEICDDVKNGKIYPSARTIENAVELTKHLMKKYNIPAENVIRHYDVTGKLCPAYWCGNTEKNALWKTAFWNKLGIETKPTATAEKKIKVETAASFAKVHAKTYTVTASALNMRRGAGTTKQLLKTLKKGEKFTCYGYYTNNGGTIWLLGVDKDGNTGFCSKAYLK